MRAVITRFLILLMGLHLLVPAGFMPGWSGAGAGAGGPTLVICNGNLLDPLRAPLSGGDSEREHGQQSLCPYASFGAVALDATSLAPAAVPVAYHAAAFPVSAAFHILPVRWQRPSVRAPPVAA